MKDRFQEFSVLSKSSILNLFKDCIFVFDTNVLLNMYRYSEETSSSWFDSLTKIKDRVYLPYIVGYEFYKNRLETIEAENRLPNKIQGEIDKLTKALEKQFQDNRRLNDKNSELKDLLNKTQESLNTIISHKKIDIYDDHILQRIETIFSEKVVGAEHSEEDKKRVLQEGKRRFDDKIPPGYEDGKKESLDQYNDYLIWNDILSKAISQKVDVIFVTDDGKTDWWKTQVNEGRPIFLPHPLLRKEFKEKTQKKYFQLKPGDFISLLNEFIKQDVNPNVITETNEVSQSILEANFDDVISEQSETRKKYLQIIAKRFAEQNNDSLLKLYADHFQETAYNKALLDAVLGEEIQRAKKGAEYSHLSEDYLESFARQWREENSLHHIAKGIEKSDLFQASKKFEESRLAQVARDMEKSSLSQVAKKFRESFSKIDLTEIKKRNSDKE